jgi:Flp pilus assembly protein TadG
MASLPFTSQQFANDQRGSIGVTFGLMLAVCLVFIGSAVDYGRTLQVRSKLQSAADSAALAALKVPNSQQQTVALNYFNSNFNTPNVTSVTPTLTRPTATRIQVAASANVVTPFLAIANIDHMTVNVVAKADFGSVTAAASPCAIVLDKSVANAFQFISENNVNAPDCEVHVHSNSSHAVNLHSPENSSFKSICDVGGAWDYQGNATSWSPTLHLVKNCNTVLADPLVGKMPSVNVGECESGNTNKTYTNANLSPGTYCGNTTIGGLGTTNLAAGLYIVSGGTLTINTKVLKGAADGVTFYLADANAKLIYSAKEDSNNNPNVFLKAPTTGTYKDLLVFEAPGLVKPTSITNYRMQILSADKQTWAGIIYLPNSNLNINSTSDWHVCKCAFIVNTLKTDSLSTFPWTPYKTFAGTASVTDVPLLVP